MKGVMSSSRGNDTYVVIFRRSLAECSNRCRDEGRGGTHEQTKQQVGYPAWRPRQKVLEELLLTDFPPTVLLRQTQNSGAS